MKPVNDVDAPCDFQYNAENSFMMKDKTGSSSGKKEREREKNKHE